MPRFGEVLRDAGVHAASRFVVVGLGASTAVPLHDAKTVDLRFDQKKVDIHVVKRENVTRLANVMYDQFAKWGLFNEEASKNYQMALSSSLQGPHSSLLWVTGKTPGLHDVQVISGGITLKLEVAVVPSLSFTLAFRFLQHLDDSNTMRSFTSWTPSDAPWLYNKLNWTYRMQANISFDLLDADWVKVNQVLGEPLSEKAFLNSVASGKNTSADLNVFLVGTWKGGEAGGTYYADVKSAVVEGSPNPSTPVTQGDDPFLVTLAHEVAHFLTYEQESKMFHHDRQNVLLCSGIEGSRIDQDLLLKMNSPW
jgi:hypothetical protein